MTMINDEKNRSIIEKQAATIRLLTDLSEAGSWTINYAPDGSVASVRWGDGFRRLMGYHDQSDFPNALEPFVQGIHPEDRDVFMGDITASRFDESTMRTAGYDFRFFKKDGTVRWFRSKGMLTRDPEGRPLQYRGVTIDITEVKEHDVLYAELHNEAASLDTIHEMLGSGKWTMDFDEAGVMVQVKWSDEFRRMIGYHGMDDFPDVLESWSDLLHPDDKERVLNEYNETILDYTGKKTYDVEYRLRTKNRGYRWYRAVGKPTRRSDGSPITYVGVFIDITEQKEMVLKLAEQRESLSVALENANQANKAKTAFLSNMSHEIRTPMNAIIGLDSLALRNASLPEETRGYLEKIGESARHLLGLINDILDMSRIESGRLMLRKEEFSFSAMLEQLNTMVMTQCSEKGLHYECNVVGGVSDYYIGDDMKLKQVLINILSNAVKFTDAPGSITLTVERTAVFDEHSSLKFRIKDTGIGMDQAFIPKIFDPFSQENSSRNNKYGSTGLGMAITKNMVELMNGTISVESEKGAGTEVTVVVTLTNSRHQGPAVNYFDPMDMRVLVVDDEEIAAEHARIVLEEVGIKAETCYDGQTALQMLEVQHAKNDPFSLVLLDWKMPGMDGLELAKEIRKRYDRETTVIILTSFNWDEIMDEALHIGVDSFLSKPLFASNVLGEFERVVRKNGLEILKEKKRADLKGRHILMAEDVMINAEIMKELIQMREAEIDHAENGKIALDMFGKSPVGHYDAILMDVRMPEMDGLEAAAAIRSLKRPDAKTIPIIAMTANAFDEDVQRSLQAGMNSHLSKPVDPEHLYRTLEELIYEKSL